MSRAQGILPPAVVTVQIDWELNLKKPVSMCFGSTTSPPTPRKVAEAVAIRVIANEDREQRLQASLFALGYKKLR